MKKLLYPACFYPCEEQEGYTVVVPDLPGCVTQGRSLIDTIGMAVRRQGAVADSQVFQCGSNSAWGI